MRQCYLLVGPSGAGKSTQAGFLVQRFGFHFISTGELLRQHYPELVLSGQLVDSGVVEKLLENALASVPKDKAVLLDGFPRTVDQQGWLDNHLSVLGFNLVLVLHLEISHEASLARLEERGRDDDIHEANLRRWQIYQEQTVPMLTRYEGRGIIRRINADQSKEQVSKDLIQALED